ncbi:MAG TPA: hypothetical protein VG965_03440 [Patescibacteria group bacterium]|nr:hypothetical protein [Patescibacteria group bacterium]
MENLGLLRVSEQDARRHVRNDLVFTGDFRRAEIDPDLHDYVELSEMHRSGLVDFTNDIYDEIKMLGNMQLLKLIGRIEDRKVPAAYTPLYDYTVASTYDLLPNSIVHENLSKYYAGEAYWRIRDGIAGRKASEADLDWYDHLIGEQLLSWKQESTDPETVGSSRWSKISIQLGMSVIIVPYLLRELDRAGADLSQYGPGRENPPWPPRESE